MVGVAVVVVVVVVAVVVGGGVLGGGGVGGRLILVRANIQSVIPVTNNLSSPFSLLPSLSPLLSFSLPSSLTHFIALMSLVLPAGRCCFILNCVHLCVSLGKHQVGHYTQVCQYGKGR